MGELSGNAESSSDVTAGEGGQGGSDQPDRPKLVALPEPTEAPIAVASSAASRADAGRLALERSLSGPPAQGLGIARVRLPAPAIEPATDLAAYTVAPAPGYAPRAPQPQGLADAIAVTVTATPELVQALRAELAMRAHAEAGLRARAVDAETRLATRLLLSQRTVEALRMVRAELDQLAGLLTDERTRRQAAEQRVAELEQQLVADRGRSDDADREIADLRASLQQLRTPAEREATADPGDESPGGAAVADGSPGAVTEVRAERLTDALTRLRAITEPIDQLPAPADALAPAGLTPVTASVTPNAPRATLAGPFRTLCRRDPALAGQLALSLLPLQRIAYPHPVAYDIVLGPGHGCVQVTSSADRIEVARQATGRPLEQVDFQLVGGPERFAKLLAAGRIRRRFGFWVLSRVRGNRHRLEALDALLALPLGLPALVEAELSTDPLILAQLQAWINRAQSE